VETPDGNWLENAELEYGEVPRIPGKKKPGANKSMREAKKKKKKKKIQKASRVISSQAFPRTETAQHTKEGAESKWDDDPE
jgi:hypothetical protein